MKNQNESLIHDVDDLSQNLFYTSICKSESTFMNVVDVWAVLMSANICKWKNCWRSVALEAKASSITEITSIHQERAWSRRTGKQRSASILRLKPIMSKIQIFTSSRIFVCLLWVDGLYTCDGLHYLFSVLNARFSTVAQVREKNLGKLRNLRIWLEWR